MIRHSGWTLTEEVPVINKLPAKSVAIFPKMFELLACVSDHYISSRKLRKIMKRLVMKQHKNLRKMIERVEKEY
jgi:Asp-tRNA(Asn)/Glu-tRNA(Gln) amidotransferase B subunit